MNPKRLTQIEKALYILDQNDVFPALKDNQQLLFLIKKIERVTAAIYILTESFFNSEPLKWELREAGLHSLKNILSLKERTFVQSREFLNDVLASVMLLLSLIHITYVSDLISYMNFSVLKKELEGLQDLIVGKGKNEMNLTPPPFLKETFFAISKDLFSSGPDTESDVRPSAGYASSLPGISQSSKTSKGQKVVKTGVLDAKNTSTTSERGIDTDEFVKKPYVHPASDKLNEERKQLILSVLRTNEPAMIKDFLPVVKGCSEKTIQRRLLELVRDGVLRKEGERRWSKYYLSKS